MLLFLFSNSFYLTVLGCYDMSSAPEGRSIANNNFRPRVKANMLLYMLFVTKYDQKNHKSMGLILLLEHSYIFG